MPAPRDEDAPEDDGLDEALDRAEEDGRWDPDEEDDDLAGTGPGPVWPQLGTIPPALARPTAGRVMGGRCPGCWMSPCPGPPWPASPSTPGLLGRIGPITATQARHLAAAAETDPAVPWRVIVTNPAGQAIAVTRIRRRTRASPVPGSPAATGPAATGRPGTGLVGRVTLTISQDTITAAQQAPAGPDHPPGRPAAGPQIRQARPARRPDAATGRDHRGRAAGRHPALDRAPAQARADQAAGGCAHTGESPAYRPPPRLREHVIARDVTCRNPACRQPAWRADLDHTHPYDHDGRTCDCNLGGACRSDHQLKQHPRWKLEQTTARPLHLDHARRTHLRHHPRHPSGVGEELMGWNNPPLPWHELERRLSWGDKGGESAAPAGRTPASGTVPGRVR